MIPIFFFSFIISDFKFENKLREFWCCPNVEAIEAVHAHLAWPQTVAPND